MEKLSKADLEKEAILNPEKAEKRRQMRRRARLMAVITVLCVFCVVCTTGLMVVRAMGKSSIMSKGGGQEPAISTDINVMDKVEQWQEGWIGYKDKIYEYNDDIMTFLIMGIGFLLATQAMFNMMVAVGILPVTGQPLPLISKGGTATLVNSAYIGIILSVSRYVEELKKKEQEEALTAAGEKQIPSDSQPEPAGEA